MARNTNVTSSAVRCGTRGYRSASQSVSQSINVNTRDTVALYNRAKDSFMKRMTMNKIKMIKKSRGTNISK